MSGESVTRFRASSQLCDGGNRVGGLLLRRSGEAETGAEQEDAKNDRWFGERIRMTGGVSMVTF